MASITGLGKIGLPRLSENMDPDDARALRNYLYQMQEQLQYVLCNLDTENFSEELRGSRLPRRLGRFLRLCKLLFFLFAHLF